MGEERSSIPHVVCVPYPLQGHINPMLKLAKLLHHHGFHVTFVNTHLNHTRIINMRTSLRDPPPLAGFAFESIPLHHPTFSSSSSATVGQTLHELSVACEYTFPALFRDLVARLNGPSSSTPPVTCVLSDNFMSYTLAVSDELGIPNVVFCNIGASGYLSFRRFCEKLMQYPKFLAEPRNENDISHLDELIEWNPGYKQTRLRDLFDIMQATDLDKFMPSYHIGLLERASKASAIVFHTFDALEGDVLNQRLSSIFESIYSIGPLELLLKNNAGDRYDYMECNLWKDNDAKCVEWLDSKQSGSVVYVNFGTTTVMTGDQQVELAWGLANSKQSFVWIVREDMITGDGSVALPQDFWDEIKDRGLLASWCPQEQVLKHPAIGGFVTHSGWSSTMESISAGIPMVCWPFFGDHFENCRNCCYRWGIGMELTDDKLTRVEVEELVKELVVGEKGKQMRSKVLEWKKKASEAASTTTDGSSSVNLNNLIKEVFLSKQRS